MTEEEYQVAEQHEETASQFATRGWCYLLTVWGIALAVWLQVVGVTVDQKLAHVLEAAPILVLLLSPRRPLTHLAAVLLGFSWIWMLTVVSPELQGALSVWPEAGLVSWLAPVMVVLSAGWMALHLATLRESKRSVLWFAPSALLTIPLCFALSPHLMRFFSEPLMRALSGSLVWVLVLLGELAFLLGGVVALVRWSTAAKFGVTPRGAGLFASYWIFFLACMVGSQAVK